MTYVEDPLNRIVNVSWASGDIPTLTLVRVVTSTARAAIRPVATCLAAPSLEDNFWGGGSFTYSNWAVQLRQSPTIDHIGFDFSRSAQNIFENIEFTQLKEGGITFGLQDYTPWTASCTTNPNSFVVDTYTGVAGGSVSGTLGGDTVTAYARMAFVQKRNITPSNLKIVEVQYYTNHGLTGWDDSPVSSLTTGEDLKVSYLDD